MSLIKDNEQDAKPDILVVDDTPQNLDILTMMLTSQDYRVRAAINGELALKAAKKSPPDVILLDINMPKMDGFEVCRHLKADPEMADIPVIFISALNDVSQKVKAFETGGVDYVTKPFNVEEVLARVESQLVLARQRNEIIALVAMKDQMMRTVSHDLKNPIHNIMGYTQLILEAPDMLEDTAQMLDIIDIINRNSKRMYTLVRDLLELTTTDNIPLEIETVALDQLLTDHLTNYQLTAQEKDIQLYYNSPGDVSLNMDPKRIAQVINNFLSNAVKYTPSGGQVTLSGWTQDDYAIVRVEDTGLGIPEDALPHLFENFYRVHTKEHLAVEGTGLGLAIAKAIIDQHKGEIWAESELGQGSAFSFALPLT